MENSSEVAKVSLPQAHCTRGVSNVVRTSKPVEVYGSNGICESLEYDLAPKKGSTLFHVRQEAFSCPDFSRNFIEFNNGTYTSNTVYDKNGHIHVERKCHKPFTKAFGYGGPKRTFAEGFKGKLEKIGLKVAQDSKGREIPVLRRIGALIFNLARKIR